MRTLGREHDVLEPIPLPGSGTGPDRPAVQPQDGVRRPRWSRFLALGAALALAFAAGRASERYPIVTDQPSGSGVGWECDGRLTAVLRFTGLPPDAVRVRLESSEEVPAQLTDAFADLLVGVRGASGGFVPKPSGELQVVVHGLPFGFSGGTATFVTDPASPGGTPSPHRLRVPVVHCGRAAVFQDFQG